MSQSVFLCMYLILLIYITATHTAEGKHIMYSNWQLHLSRYFIKLQAIALMQFTLLHTCTSETVCGSAYLQGPLDEIGSSPILLRKDVNLSDGNPITIKCQLNRTNLSVKYVKKLRIYFTNPRDGEDLFHTLAPGDRKFKNKFYEETVGNITNYYFNITVDPRLNRSIITCGAGYRYQVGYKYCYTASAALIILRDDISCHGPTTLTEIPTTPAPNTSPTDVQSIIMNKSVFFPVVGIAILVGIILLVANGIQLWVIIITMKTRRTVSISATNGMAHQLGTEDIDSKVHGDESEDDSTMGTEQ